MTSFINMMKSSISIINGILIILLFLLKPFRIWWHRYISSKSKRNKLILYIQGEKRVFNCIEKRLISEPVFDYPHKEMDSGLIKTSPRGYRFKINALIYGNKIYEYLPEGYSKIIITHNNKTIEMLPFLIEKIGKIHKLN